MVTKMFTVLRLFFFFAEHKKVSLVFPKIAFEIKKKFLDLPIPQNELDF